jgi:8-oxo-dGTP pyrophosphatase MutT (NUDIX family)
MPSMLEEIKRTLKAFSPQKKELPIGLSPNSAVLFPLFEMEGDAGVVLIHRARDGGPHSAQMGFPGGMADPSDRGDLLRTALRESREELGIEPADVKIIGELGMRPTIVSGLVVKPYVGIIPWPYHLRPDPREVQGAHITSIRYLAREVAFGANSFDLPPPVYPVDGRPVWGLTARFITELLLKLDSVIPNSEFHIPNKEP